jgi:hypothetical protein
MNIIVLVPNVVRRYIASFPETTNNAYKYFNYDNRVVEERVPRGDVRMPYKGPQDFTDSDYESLVACAQHGLDPVLVRYSKTVACDDALSAAIRSFNNGQFDGKVNASRYAALLGALKEKCGIKLTGGDLEVQAKAKEKVQEKAKAITPHILKQLGIKKVPHDFQVGKTKGPTVVREKGKIVLKNKDK